MFIHWHCSSVDHQNCKLSRRTFENFTSVVLQQSLTTAYWSY